MLATQSEVSDGTLSIINVGIQFFKQADISVSLDQSDLPLVLGVDYVWSAATTITFLDSVLVPGGFVPNGVEVFLRRDTKNDEMYNILDGGAPFSRLTLDENYKQLLYLTQEFSEGLGLDGLRNNLNMNGYRVVSVGNPVAGTDAANKDYIDGSIASTIRSPGEALTPLASAAERAGKLLGFDSFGMPVATLPGSGSAVELALDLLNSADPAKGAALVARFGGGTLSDLFSTSSTLGLSLFSGAGRVIADLATLRNLPITGVKSVWVKWHTSSDFGGGGRYDYDASDVTTPDNNGTVIVSTDGGRWKLDKSLWINGVDVRTFGAKADDATMAGTDSTVAIQAARNWAVANKVSRVLVFGQFLMSTGSFLLDTALYTQNLWLEGGGALTSRIRQNGNDIDVVTMSSVQFMRNSGIRNIELMAMPNAGHGVNIVYGATCCVFDQVNVTVLNPLKRLYAGFWSALALGDGGMFDCHWIGGDLYTDVTHGSFAIEFITNGTCFNENSFSGQRWNGGGISPFFHTANIHGASYLVNNRFQNINCEKLAGGGFLVSGIRGWSWDGISFWDTALYNNHLIQVVASGLQSIGFTMKNIQRNGDSLAGGVYDILLAAGAAAQYTIQNCTFFSGTSNFSNCVGVEFGNVFGTLLNANGTASVDRLHVRTGSVIFAGATGVASFIFGVGSVSRSSPGVYVINFVDKGSVNFSCIPTLRGTPTGWSIVSAISSNSVTITCTRFDLAAYDPVAISVDFFG